VEIPTHARDLVAGVDEVVRKALHNRGGLAGLSGCGILSDKDGLLCLHEDSTICLNDETNQQA
jgi:hypothetical protein